MFLSILNTPDRKKVFISFYNFMERILKPKPVLGEVSLDDIVLLAEKQKNLKTEEIKISVVIPNYNYARFLYQRVYSILTQDYKIYELIKQHIRKDEFLELNEWQTRNLLDLLKEVKE